MIALFLTAWNITAPILWALVAGITLRRLGIIGPGFIKKSNWLVFMVVLPAALFLSLAGKPIDQPVDISLTGFGILYTLGTVLLLWFVSRRYMAPDLVGVFVQSAFRGNMGIVGLTLVVGAYGQDGLVVGGFYVGMNTIMYNVCAVWLLHAPGKKLMVGIFTNPLIIASLIGLAWSLSPLPRPISETFSLAHLVKFILPIALISIGASLEWSSLKKNRNWVLAATGLKLIALPIVAVVLGYLLGIEGMSLGILAMMMATPTAAASYVMAQQMTVYGKHAAETVAVSTLLSPLTMTLALIALTAMTDAL